MDEIGTKYNATPAQIALNWVINFNDESVITIPGATKVHQAQESAGAMKFKLAPDDLTHLDEISRALK